ncbi:peptidyl-prolyl cis-trans isomerase FKBP17-2, chloroplastic [Lotus japonicus]|uniref:peptidylprolyl isomerase n=1 Tax=Lotus japonicus TaxID=34305 RepID=I3S4J1_LOTJA|nr:peptidyl-prolyl cis-trans isomerase FKBP17-2, chloroplastic [Lotus japonicus]XP_057419908.1 peptidyl-prolyl cis-trans isomerase FKBP17-2, chloroplastic [Lotus japonicus]AFK35183.1 unknown [Lotus japonicus]
MATFFGSPPVFSLPLTRNSHHIASSSPTPPPIPPQQSQSPTASSSQSVQGTAKAQPQNPIKPVTSSTKVDSTDWIATSLTRRFGLGAGLAWVGFLAFGVVSEQIKTRLEVSQQEANTRDVEKEEEVTLPNGIRYCELKVGGGASPRPGDLVVIDIMGKVESTGEVFVNTFEGDKKPLALVMGSRPYSKGVCEGIEYVLKTMKAGGKRKVIVPPQLGFRENGADLGSGVQIPPLATLEYIVEVDKVSIAPA